MAIQLVDNFRVSKQAPLDCRTVAETVETALAGIDKLERFVGLMVYITELKEVWVFKDGIEDANFQQFTISGSEVRVDDKTIEIVNPGTKTSYIQLKAGNNTDQGIRLEHFNSNALKLADGELQAEAQLPSTEYLDKYAIIQEFECPVLTPVDDKITWTVTNTGLQKRSTVTLFNRENEVCIADITVNDNIAIVCIDTDTPLNAGDVRLVMTGKIYKA